MNNKTRVLFRIELEAKDDLFTEVSGDGLNAEKYPAGNFQGTWVHSLDYPSEKFFYVGIGSTTRVYMR